MRLSLNPLSLPHSGPVPSGKLSWSQIGNGAARACSVVCLGRSHVQTKVSCSSYSLRSFGLLHRIPPIPDDRQPGTLPSELQDSTEVEEHTLYVPADSTSDQLDLEFHTDAHDQHQPIYSPPHSHDCSHSYFNRGAAIDRQLPSSTIPEEYEETESYLHSSRSSQDSGSDRHYHHHGYDVGAVPTSNPRSSLSPDMNSNGDSRS